MENVNLKDIKNWKGIKDLYLSNDQESWRLADSILEQVDKSVYKNQVSALLKIIPDGRSEIACGETWSMLLTEEIQTGNKECVQMLADIYSEYLNSIIFDDEIFQKFDIKLTYNGG